MGRERKATYCIRPKGQGRGIMVSDFVDEFNGLLTLTEGEFERGRLMYSDLKKKVRVLLNPFTAVDAIWRLWLITSLKIA